MEITIGNLVDQLSIVNIRIWMLEDAKRDIKASDKEVAEATRKTNVLNTHRNNLIEAIDAGLNKMVGADSSNTYGQGSTKMYR